MSNQESFTLVSDPDDFYEKAKNLVVRISSGISNLEELFKVLEDELKFPYFGHNWDSLDELLRDFSWLKSRQIVIVHQELPVQLGEKNLRSYLKVLLRGVKDWKPEEEHELIVVFPTVCQEEIKRILQ
jgi:hypothetical protein